MGSTKRPVQLKLIGSPGVTPVSSADGAAGGGNVSGPDDTWVLVAVSVMVHEYVPVGVPAEAAVAVMTDAPMAAPMNPPTRARAPIADPSLLLPNKVDLLLRVCDGCTGLLPKQKAAWPPTPSSTSSYDRTRRCACATQSPR